MAARRRERTMGRGILHGKNGKLAIVVTGRGRKENWGGGGYSVLKVVGIFWKMDYLNDIGNV